MKPSIVITKDSHWMKWVGLMCLIPGLVALIPFKANYLQVWDISFCIIAAFGIIILLRASQRIGWRLNLEDNILYYSKFDLYSSWKKRRSQEFSLSVKLISKVEIKADDFIIVYHPNRKLSFNIRGLSAASYARLNNLKEVLETQIITKHS